MAIELSTTMKGSYVVISCHGIYSKDSVLEAFDKSLDIAEDNNVTALLIDIRNVLLEGPPPDTFERFQFGEKVAEIQLKRSKRIFLAVVGKKPLIDPERFAETVAVNRGAYGKVFDEMEEAIRWVKRNARNKNAQ